MRWIVGVAAAACALAAFANDVGQVKSVRGNVQVERGGQRLSVEPGMNVWASDVLHTGADSAVGVTFLDNNIGGAATVRTDAVIEGLLFVFRDAQRAPTTNPANVSYVETQITVRTRRIDPATGLPETRLLTQEVRLRGRNF